MKELRDFFIDLFVATFFRFRNLRNKYVFIWIPKNAGTSIYLSMRKRGMIKYKRLTSIKWFYNSNFSLTFGHTSLDSLIASGMLKEDEISGAHFFTVLRDPYERFNSIYNYYQDAEVFDRYHQINSKNDILDILESGYYPKVGLYHHISLSMFNTQSSWIPQNRKVTFLRQENLQEDATNYFSNLNENLDLKIGQFNSSATKENKLSEEQRLRIRKIYHEDFELISSLKKEGAFL
jgi:hypothetical protein